MDISILCLRVRSLPFCTRDEFLTNLLSMFVYLLTVKKESKRPTEEFARPSPKLAYPPRKSFEIQKLSACLGLLLH